MKVILWPDHQDKALKMTIQGNNGRVVLRSDEALNGFTMDCISAIWKAEGAEVVVEREEGDYDWPPEEPQELSTESK